MSDSESKRRTGDLAPVAVVAALPTSTVSLLVDALRGSPFVAVPATNFEETRVAIEQSSCAVLVAAHQVDPLLADWLDARHEPSAHAPPPILLLCERAQIEEACASGIGDLVVAVDSPPSQILQSIVILTSLAAQGPPEPATRDRPSHSSSELDPFWPALLQGFPLGLIVADDSGNIEFGNQAAANLLGKTPDQLAGVNLRSLLDDSGIEAGLKSATVPSSWIAGDFVRTRGAAMVEIDYLAMTFASSARQVVILQDATERNRSAARQQRIDKMDSLGRLVGGMAHEFNNLLTVILGYSDLSARLAAPDSRFSEALLQIKNSAERGAQLTQLLLAFGRKQLMAPTWIDFNQLLTSLEGHLRKVAGEGIHVEIQQVSGLPLVFVDPTLVQRVLVNMVTNARDALKKNGVLTLTTSGFDAEESAPGNPELRPGRYVCLTVRDNGPGIPSEILPFLFEPFFTTKSVGQGTGMGLAFVDGVMHQGGGSVDVFSELGKGTTFRLFFPTIGKLPASQSASLPAGGEHDTGATILWADDDEGVRKFGTLVLRGQGYYVIEACNGAEALRLVELGMPKIDLVVTDVVMPVMGGIELGNKLGALFPDLPILYQSGRLEDLRQEGEQAVRNRHFLTKPFTRETLLAKVGQLLRKPG